MNKRILFGLILNALIALIVAASGEYSAELVSILWLMFMVSVIGAVLIALDAKKTGSYFVLAGCLPFLPAGIVGILGAINVLRDVRKETDKYRSPSQSSTTNQAIPDTPPIPEEVFDEPDYSIDDIREILSELRNDYSASTDKAEREAICELIEQIEAKEVNLVQKSIAENPQPKQEYQIPIRNGVARHGISHAPPPPGISKLIIFSIYLNLLLSVSALFSYKEISYDHFRILRQPVQTVFYLMDWTLANLPESFLLQLPSELLPYLDYAFLAVLTLIGIIGFNLASRGFKPVGLMLTTISCAVFSPIGLIGVYGSIRSISRDENMTHRRINAEL